MPHDPRALLWDIQQAGTLIADFIVGVTPEQFEHDELLRSAVERKFSIIGEATAQLHKAAPEMAQALPDYRAVIALRNVLIHGYAVIKAGRVWHIARHDLPLYLTSVQALLDQPPAAAPPLAS